MKGAATQPLQKCTKSSGLMRMGPSSAERRKSVSFAAKVRTRVIPRVPVDEISHMFYSKFDFRLFATEKRFSDQHAISEVIHRVAGKTVTDMGIKMKHIESLQQIEQDLVKQSSTENRDDVAAPLWATLTASVDDGSSSDGANEKGYLCPHEQMEEEQILQHEMCRLVIEREMTKHKLERSIPKPSLVIDTYDQWANDMELLDLDMCNFTPVRFDTVLCPSLASTTCS
jgi:hypothetical protein